MKKQVEYPAERISKYLGGLPPHLGIEELLNKYNII